MKKSRDRKRKGGETKTGCQLNQLRAMLTKNTPLGYVTGSALRTETTQELLSFPSYFYVSPLNHQHTSTVYRSRVNRR